MVKQRKVAVTEFDYDWLKKVSEETNITMTDLVSVSIRSYCNSMINEARARQVVKDHFDPITSATRSWIETARWPDGTNDHLRERIPDDLQQMMQEANEIDPPIDHLKDVRIKGKNVKG